MTAAVLIGFSSALPTAIIDGRVIGPWVSVSLFPHAGAVGDWFPRPKGKCVCAWWGYACGGTTVPDSYKDVTNAGVVF